jgi:hypothetical protein
MFNIITMKYIKLIVFAVLSGLLITSCDVIEAPYIEATGGGTDTSECPLPEFPHVHNPIKNVLLEDYTGHTCVNCPTAAKIAHDLKEVYGSKLVILSVHAGFFAQPAGSEFPEDFRCEAGNDWDNLFGISAVGNPNGMVDRVGYDTEHVLSPGAWGGKVVERLAEPVIVDLQIINDYNENDRKLCSHTEVYFFEDVTRNLKLCVLITESNIVAPQKNNDPQIGPTPVIEDYEHEHVLRGAINSSWGMDVTTSDEIVHKDEAIIKSYKMILDQEWNANNCTVISFVYDADTYEVLQVMEESVFDH